MKSMLAIRTVGRIAVNRFAPAAVRFSSSDAAKADDFNHSVKKMHCVIPEGKDRCDSCVLYGGDKPITCDDGNQSAKQCPMAPKYHEQD
eukprot:CAMPEP_0181310616 /NCGR_PEP_ID=MMETSP1101-20121128/12684_1 /TAXON_ID=46948 /ORGANISM="Rhodomonas abbreviata, Strain Caron Lab Isolate" /LENGTH=88 /DNA_ID=CAMNT_0023417263 /DNA_START=41 /DNA_END=307 /DNA_ORIENTATION=-